MITTVFWERTNLDQPMVFPFDVKVKQYSWNVFGGPEEMTAEIQFGGNNEALLWSLTRMLRCGVWVLDNVGRVVWWGYVHEIKINNGWRSYGVNLDTMFNRIKCTYELIVDGSNTGLRADTTWIDDEISATEFGYKEKVYPLVTVSIDAAEADAETRLAKSKFPTSVADLQIREDAGVSVELLCKGWWYTLDWLYYENANTSYEAVEDQIVTMIDAGEFTVEVLKNFSAAALTTEYRKGDNMIRDEVEQLMNIGTDNSLRVFSKYDKDQFVYLWEEPEAGVNDYYLDKNNQLYDSYGVPVDATECKVGVWAILKDFQGVPFNTITTIPPSPVFLERAVYNVEEGKYQPEQRGYKSPYDEIQDIQR